VSFFGNFVKCDVKRETRESASKSSFDSLSM